MVTVAYIGNFIPEHSTENHVRIALNNLGHEVRPIQESHLDWSTVPQLTAGSDILLWTRTSGFDSDRQQQRSIIKGLDIPSCGFHLDRWWGLRRENTEGGPADPNRSPFFDCSWVFTADGDPTRPWEEYGIRHIWSPPAVLSNETELGTPRQEFIADVGFVGNLRRYGHPEWAPYRQRLYRFLATTYRGRFKLWEGGIRGRDLASLYQSVKVLVGDSCLAGNPSRYWSDRIPETLGRGGYLIHPWVDGLFDDYKLLATYRLGDFDNLRYMIDWWLSPEHEEDRRHLAEKNRAHVLANHTYEHRMERILATVLS